MRNTRARRGQSPNGTAWPAASKASLRQAPSEARQTVARKARKSAKASKAAPAKRTKVAAKPAPAKERVNLAESH